MSLVQEIFYILSNYPGDYRMLYDILYDGKPPGQSDKSFEHSLRSTLTRMKRLGLLNNTSNEWSLTQEGGRFLNAKKSNIKRFFPIKNRSVKTTFKNLIIIFDIPEKKRRYRDWLRIELVNFGFEQIQKSVWFGPSLPKNFVEYLNEINLLEYIRFFKANEKDII